MTTANPKNKVAGQARQASMSSDLMPHHQRISDTSATDGSIALAGHFPHLTQVAIGAHRSSPEPKPSSTVPFRRDPDFVDRGDLLSRVEERCSRPAGNVALVGLGGVGKSQLAIEYTYRVQDRSPDTWIFWVHASNAARFKQGYGDIASLVKIKGRDDPKADIFKLVHDWLRGYEGTWLMVLDNVDSADFLVNAQGPDQNQSSDSSRPTLRPLRDYIPQSQNGSILVTTRSRESALKLVEQSALLPVEPMNISNAIELLGKKLESADQENNDDYIELAAALEFMPLAIVQAAAYITQGESRCSIQQYLSKFRRNDYKKTSLLNHEGGQLRRDRDAKNSIILTWQISFDRIRQTRPSAADLLSLMSFFDRQGIPESLIRNRGQATDGLMTREERDTCDGDTYGKEDHIDGNSNSMSESDTDEDFENDVRVLRNYYLVSFEGKKTFAMHALVQLATRKWLEANGKLEQWKQCYIKNLSAEFPPGRYENWTTCRALFPHAKSAVSQRPKAQHSLRDWAILLYHTAWYMLGKGTINEAIDLSEMAMKAWQEICGQEHKDTLKSMAMVGKAYKSGGRWKEAEELFLQVVELRKRLLGLEHPDTLLGIALLASTYWSQGPWKDAEELEVQETEPKKRILGQEHSSTFDNIGNLASTYWNQGRWKEAEKLEIKVLEIRKRVLGQEHPDTLKTMASLAGTFRNQARWKEAEELDVQVIEIRKRVLGHEHPDTLKAIGNLALTYSNQGRWKEAEELGLQVIEIKKRVLGVEHPDTLTSMANIVWIYWNKGRSEEAQKLGLQLTKSMKRVLGQEYPDTLKVISNLALIYSDQGR